MAQKFCNDKDEKYEIQGLLLQQTARAYLIAVDNDKEVWIAKSQAENVQIQRDEISCDIPVWLASKANLL